VLIPDYLDAQTAARLLRLCRMSLPWHEESVRLFGRTLPVPRRIAWVADAGIDYRYSGRAHMGTGWPGWLEDLKSRLRADFGRAFNHLVFNQYRDGEDCMGWHRDDERGVVGEVAILSLGATRTLRWRHARSGPSASIRLDAGSLLRLDGRIYHSLVRELNLQHERISLSFREIRSAQNAGRTHRRIDRVRP
jgi:alkylated DNA repair dioxygenase AlkB